MAGLTQAEVVGIEIVARMRTGDKKLRSFSCDTCTDEMKESRDCGMNGGSDKSVYYDHALGEFYSCPIRFIPSVVMDFLDEYDYYEYYPATAPKYADVNPRFWESVKLLKSAMNKLEMQEVATSKPANNSANNVKKLDSIFGKGGSNAKGK